MEAWMPLFVALVAVAVALQAILLAAIYFQVRGTARRIDQVSRELQERVYPLISKIETIVEDVQPRVVMTFPQNPNDMLLSGTLAGGQALSGRAAAIDVPLGKGHVVLFALRPFWRWQTQGTYFLGFNAILNWNHLDAGKAEERPQRRRPSARQ